MPARTSKAVWNGDLQSGTGQMVVGNNAYTGDFSFKSRFEEGAGTNPEELIAAAHAGCYSMQLSAMLATAGKNPTSVSTTAHVTLTMVDDKPMTALTQTASAFPKNRVLGQAGVLDTARFTHFVAEKLGVPVGSVKTLTARLED